MQFSDSSARNMRWLVRSKYITNLSGKLEIEKACLANRYAALVWMMFSLRDSIYLNDCFCLISVDFVTYPIQVAKDDRWASQVR